MPTVNIKLHNKEFGLYCADGQQESLLNLVSEVNEKLLAIQKINKSASFELLLVLAVLSLQDELSNLRKQLDSASDTKAILQEKEKLSDTLSQIAVYLEDLAKKMSK